MKTQFICEEFTLDLTNKEMFWIEENPWFSEEIFLSSTFPFSIDFDEADYFLQFKNHNFHEPKFKFKGKLQKANGELILAELVLEKSVEKLSGFIRIGVEVIETWDLFLNQLDLGIVEPSEGMLPHALTVINKSYPETNYQYPMIFCYNVYEDDQNFSDFLGYYNYKLKDGNFVPNIAIPEENIYNNFNIVYPFPYYMHILKRGFELGGYSLHGDILEDEDLLKKVMPISKKIELFNRPEVNEWIVGYGDMIDHIGWNTQIYQSEITLEPRTKYRFRGKILKRFVALTIFHGSNIFLRINKGKPNYIVDFYFTTGNEATSLLLHIACSTNTYDNVVELEAIPVEIYDENYQLISGLANFNKVDLAANLPDVTFGNFVQGLMKLKNYEIFLKNGTEIWMNLISKKLTHKDALNLSEFEIEQPERKFSETGSYILKYETDVEENELIETFVSLNEITTTNFKKESDTKEIVIPIIPLKVTYGFDYQSELTGAIITAKMFESDMSKMYFVIYDGQQNGRNVTQSVDHLMSNNLVNKYWLKFMMFDIRSVTYNWTCDGTISDFYLLNKNSKIISNNNYMIVKTLNRRQYGTYESIEIEAKTF